MQFQPFARKKSLGRDSGEARDLFNFEGSRALVNITLVFRKLFASVPRNYESRISLFYYYHDSGGIL